MFAFGETLAFLSIVIPSTAILVAVGGLVATGSLAASSRSGSAPSLGALVGSTFSWWLGLRYGPRMLNVWPLNRDPDAVEPQHGGLRALGRRRRSSSAISSGRCARSSSSPPASSMMRSLRFQLANVPAALIWAYAIPKSGEIGGNVIGHLWRGLFGA